MDLLDAGKLEDDDKEEDDGNDEEDIPKIFVTEEADEADGDDEEEEEEDEDEGDDRVSPSPNIVTPQKLFVQYTELTPYGWSTVNFV